MVDLVARSAPLLLLDLVSLVSSARPEATDEIISLIVKIWNGTKAVIQVIIECTNIAKSEVVFRLLNYLVVSWNKLFCYQCGSLEITVVSSFTKVKLYQRMYLTSSENLQTKTLPKLVNVYKETYSKNSKQRVKHRKRIIFDPLYKSIQNFPRCLFMFIKLTSPYLKH